LREPVSEVVELVEQWHRQLFERRRGQTIARHLYRVNQGRLGFIPAL
jgi:hypothetical protein